MSFNSIEEVKHKAIKSVKWSFLTEGTLKIIYPLINLIVARILSPADFGIFASATVVTSLAQLFQDFGLGRALIQKETNLKKSANVVFWGNTSLSIIFYIIIFATAPLVALFFNAPIITKILRVLALQIIFVALGSVHFSLLQRDFQFKKVFFSGLGLAFVPALISVLLAFTGYGVWALVFGSLSGTIIQTALLWKFSNWRPNLTFDIVLTKQIFGFGSWLVAESLLVWVLTQGEIIVIGRFLGINDLGIYRFASTFVLLVFGTVFNPMLSILYPSFSRLKEDIIELKKYFLQAAKIIAMLALPMGVGLALAAHPIASVILNQKWQGIGIVIFLLSFVNIMSWMVGINNGLYRAMGKPDINSKIMLLLIAVYVPVYLISAAKGLVIFCIARIFLEVFHLVVQSHWIKKSLKTNFLYLFDASKITIIATVFMGIVVYILVALMSPFLGYIGLAKLILIVLIGAVIYIGALYIINRLFLKQLFSLIKRSLL